MADTPPLWTFHFHPHVVLLVERGFSSFASKQLPAAVVEGFFAKLTRRRLRHGVLHTVVDLQVAIIRFIAVHNATKAKPSIWHADPNEIVAARNRGFQMLDSIH